MNKNIQEIEDLAAVVLVPQPPFADWLSQASPEFAGTAADVLAETMTQPVLLIPQPEDEDEIQSFLEPHKVYLLERELNEWCEDKSKWPADRTPALFDAWFEPRFYGEISVLGDPEEP